MRILHFSDIHIGVGFRRVPLSRWLSKRALGGLNLLLGRQRYFLNARRKMEALADFRKEQQVDLVIFSGDYTALGLEREYLDARSAVEPLFEAPLGYVSVPGNHDLYVRDVIRKGRFERHFAETLQTDLPQFRLDGSWPQIRLLGTDVAVIAVNSSRPNPLWRSSGRVSRKQLQGLREALQDPLLRDRFLFVVTHYAPCLADGEPDTRLHGLVNLDEFLEVCGEIDRGALLCGHVHRRFEARLPGFELPVYCAGSTTMDGREGLWLFDVEEGRLRATPGRWDGNRYCLETSSDVERTGHHPRNER